MPSVDIVLPVDNIIMYLFIAAIFEALAVYLMQFRKIPGAMLLVGCQICKGIWISAKVFCSMNPDLLTKLFWMRFTEGMPLLLTYFWFEFILQVSQQRGKVLTAVQYFIRILVVGLLFIIGLDNWLGWYWEAITVDGQVLKFDFGPGARVNMIVCYLLNLLSLGLSIRWIYSTNGLRKKQAIVLSVTPLFNLMGNVLGYTLDVQAVEAQVLGLLLSALYVTWTFYWWRIYSILPLAQEAVTRNMTDGLMVIDKKGYIVDMNPAAKTIFTGIAVTIDDHFDDVVAAWPVLSGISYNPNLEDFEANRDVDNQSYIYQIRTLLFKNPQGHYLGKTIIIKDITEQKRNQAKLVDQQKALSIIGERERLGRELHDGHGQLWSYINMQVEAARSFLDKKDVVQADVLLEKLAGVTQDVHVDLRESITGLQLTATQEEVWQTLEEYLQWFRQNYGIDTQLIRSKEFTDGLLSPTTEVQILRIIQETLTNIRKSAKARHVKIIVRVNGAYGEIWVEDDGCGFDVAMGMEKKGSFGLKIMQERAAEIGGQLHIHSTPGAGTKVQLQVPLDFSKNIKSELLYKDGKEM